VFCFFYTSTSFRDNQVWTLTDSNMYSIFKRIFSFRNIGVILRTISCNSKKMFSSIKHCIVRDNMISSLNIALKMYVLKLVSM